MISCARLWRSQRNKHIWAKTFQNITLIDMPSRRNINRHNLRKISSLFFNFLNLLYWFNNSLKRFPDTITRKWESENCINNNFEKSFVKNFNFKLVPFILLANNLDITSFTLVNLGFKKMVSSLDFWIKNYWWIAYLGKVSGCNKAVATVITWATYNKNFRVYSWLAVGLKEMMSSLSYCETCEFHQLINCIMTGIRVILVSWH